MAAAAKARLSAAAAGKKAGGKAGSSKGGSSKGGGHEREGSSSSAAAGASYPAGEEPARVALRKMIGRCLDTVVDVDQVRCLLLARSLARHDDDD